MTKYLLARCKLGIFFINYISNMLHFFKKIYIYIQSKHQQVESIVKKNPFQGLFWWDQAPAVRGFYITFKLFFLDGTAHQGKLRMSFTMHCPHPPKLVNVPPNMFSVKLKWYFYCCDQQLCSEPRVQSENPQKLHL